MTRSRVARSARVEFGDWQTPLDLAHAATLRVSSELSAIPATVVEPTCGSGALLRAAALAFPEAGLVGYDVDRRRAAEARRAVPGARIRVVDAFETDWATELRGAREPVLVLGNPPWVTSAALGRIGSSNRPERSNLRRLSGHDARTGESNFDVSEWLILRLLEALRGRVGSLAMLCKSSVARRVIEQAARDALPFAPGGLWRVPARRLFGTSVDAVLFVAHRVKDASLVPEAIPRAVSPAVSGAPRQWPEFANLDAREPLRHLALRDGKLSADAERFERTRRLYGACDPEWRSGIKHDCARVMELVSSRGGWENRLGERVDVEDAVLFPLLKSSDLANGRTVPARALLVPQRRLGEDTSGLREAAPRAWAYLCRHGRLLASRRSRVYSSRAPFAIFGVGPYSFTPWKVAISGLYKRVAFALVGPVEGRPVVLDDTCYFLPFDDEPRARAACLALQSELARDFIESRTFWDRKRPIQKNILQSLDLALLQRALSARPAPESRTRKGGDDGSLAKVRDRPGG